MKLYAMTFLLCFLHQTRGLGLGDICIPNCRDRNPLVCQLYRTQCNTNVIAKAFCPLACKVCKPCINGGRSGIATANEPSSQCDIDCKDLAPPYQCTLIANKIENGCINYPQSCRLSCNQCKPCAIPEPELECSFDCEDKHNSCDHWRSVDYCEETSEYFPYVSQRCPLSCGICEPCALPEPKNTALPPLPEGSCSEDCQDSNENCEVWKEQGYCETSDFPYLQEICRKSCEVCKACSEEELSTAVPLGESEESEILTE